jgi:hypothetical protein
MTLFGQVRSGRTMGWNGRYLWTGILGGMMGDGGMTFLTSGAPA